MNLQNNPEIIVAFIFLVLFICVSFTWMNKRTKRKNAKPSFAMDALDYALMRKEMVIEEIKADLIKQITSQVHDQFQTSRRARKIERLRNMQSFSNSSFRVMKNS